MNHSSSGNDDAPPPTYALEVDPDSGDRATEIKLWSLKRPHMRAFYVAFLSVFVGVFIWFSVSPLQVAIRDSIGLTDQGLFIASITSMSGTLTARLAAGPLCDRYGARRVMSGVLLIASLATGVTSLVQSTQGLAVCRFFSGFGGSTLVTGQFWVASMFGKTIIGTATGLVLGFGYMGGGFGILVLGALLQVLDWRIVIAIPAIAGIFTILVVLLFSDDAPLGGPAFPKRPTTSTHFLSVAFQRAASNRNSWLLAVQYGASAGANAAMANIMTLYFKDALQASDLAASSITSVIGWLGAASVVGGLLSDKMMAKRGTRGRCMVQAANLAMEGILIIVFAQVQHVGAAAFLMISFSLFATFATGSTFALVPYVEKTAIGSVAGIAGAGGSVGSIIFLLLVVPLNYYQSFVTMGSVVLLSSLLTSFLRFDDFDDDPSKGNKNAAEQDIDVERCAKETGLATAPVEAFGSVPVIDLSSGSDELLSEQLWAAATGVGFFTVVGHGITQETIDAAFLASQHFFAQPLERKRSESPFSAPLNSGFEYYSQVRPATGLADQKESVHVTARKGCMDGRWPNEDFEDRSKALMEAANNLAGRIMDYLEPKAVPNISEPGKLAKSHTLWGEEGQCCLRMIHYPPVPPDVMNQLRGAGYWRCGAHTDWTNISLVFQRVGQEGLECCANPHTADGEKRWMAVPPAEGGIAVNIGDMLARWSDGRLNSNLHRVRLPTEKESNPPCSRFSIGFFAQSDRDAMIESSSAEPVTAGDYILNRVRANFDDKKDSEQQP